MAASKKVKVDKKKITINIKKKATVKVSKKKITITGKKSGKTKLTVTVKGMIKCVIPVTVRKAGNTAVKKSDVGNNSSKNNAVSKVPAATATPVPTETPDQDSSEKENSDFKLKEYEVGRVVLVKYKGHDENVTIPDSVKPIEETAFYCCEKLESVIL